MPLKVLFATSAGDDHHSACLWDGLCDLLGEENVYDAGFTPSLHAGSGWGGACARVGMGGNMAKPKDENEVKGTNGSTGRVSGFRAGRCWSGETDFDLLVLNAAFLRDHDWHWAHTMRLALKPGGKVAFCEGWDGAGEWHNPWTESNPPFPVDAVFRREFDPAVGYGYPCPVHSLLMACPRRWTDGSDNADRPIDVFYAANYTSHPLRWEVLSAMWQTRNPHRSIGASRGVGFENYFDFLRQSKLAICPPGAAAADSLRTWEVVACGAIPIFVGYPAYKREPWFAKDEAFHCDTAAQLPGVIDHALTGVDLTMMRLFLRDQVMANHTTRARAKRMLDLLGMVP